MKLFNYEQICFGFEFHCIVAVSIHLEIKILVE